MRIEKLLIGVLILSLLACKDSKQKTEDKTQPPEVEFDFSDMPEDYEAGPDTYVRDLEQIFTKNQNEELEKYLSELDKESGKKILILTVPSKDTLNKDWKIGTGFTNSGIIITISESLKDVSIGTAKDTDKLISEKTRERIIKRNMIPEFENGNYSDGVKNGIKEILKSWE